VSIDTASATSQPVEQPSHRRRMAAPAVAVGAVALAAGLLVHLPGAFHQLFDADEAAIATMATSVTHGGTLYRDVFDRKPPLAPLLYAVDFSVTGSRSLVPLHLLVGVELGIAALVLAGEARRITGSQRAGWWTAGFLLLGAAAFRPVAAQAANYSQLALLPGTCAIVWSRRRGIGWAAAGGVALGLAVLTRQTWILGLVPAVVATSSARNWRAPAVLVSASAATIASVALISPLQAFWAWTFAGNTGLLDVSQSHNTWQRLAHSLVPFLLAHAVALVVALSRGVRRAELDLWLWLLAGVAAFFIGFRFFDHYWFQALAPLSLLAGIATVDVTAAALAVLAVGVIVPVALAWQQAWDPHGFRTDWSPVVAVIEHNSRPGDRITVWGSVPELYWLSGRDPGGGMVVSDFVVGRSAGRVDGPQRLADALPGARAQFLASLRRHPPELFLDTSTARIRSYGHYPLRLVPEVEAFVRRRYHEITVVHGIDVWARNP
jgi:hypothetical protein